MKTCARCGVTKPYAAFRFDRRRGVYRSWCRTCDAAYCRAWRAAHPGYSRAYMRTYRLTHPRPRRDPVRHRDYMRGYMRRRRAARLIQRQDAEHARWQAYKRARFAAILAAVGK